MSLLRNVLRLVGIAMHSCPMNGEQGRESYDDNQSHDLPRIYEVLGIDTDEEASSTSSFIEWIAIAISLRAFSSHY
jgi:hypothetical protein